MKVKSVLMGIASGVVLFTGTAFGHGETQTKGSCSWGWRYKAKARVNNGIGITASTQQSCGAPVTRSVSNPCAYQNANNYGSWSSFSGAVFATPWLCGRGYANSEMFYDIMHYKTSSPPADTADKVSITQGSIDFLPNKIKINNVIGFIEAKDDMKAFYQVQVWVPNHDMANMKEDTIVDPNEVLWTGKVSIVNNELVLEGGFYNEKFEVEQVGNKKKVKFSGKNFNIHLPNSVNSNDVTVIITVDGGFNEPGTLRKTTLKTETEIQKGIIGFEVFPNPANKEFMINFKPNKDASVEVKIYSIQGQLVKVLSNSEGKKDEQISIKVDPKSLNLISGTYFIYVDCGQEIYLKKLIIE